jgi:hypothetical protein
LGRLRPEIQKLCVVRTFVDIEELVGAATELDTTTTGGYFAIHISSQTTKKEVSENPHLRTITPRKLLNLCDTTTFAPVQSQVLHTSRT